VCICTAASALCEYYTDVDEFMGRVISISHEVSRLTLDSDAGVKIEQSGGVAGVEGECGDDVVGLLVRERRSLDVLPVKKEAKLSASEVPGEVVGCGEEDLRCRRAC